MDAKREWFSEEKNILDFVSQINHESGVLNVAASFFFLFTMMLTCDLTSLDSCLYIFDAWWGHYCKRMSDKHI